MGSIFTVKLGWDRFVRYNHKVAGKKTFNLHGHMGQLSWPPNSPRGSTICLKPRPHVSEYTASSCLYQILEQSGHAPDGMTDVLLGDVVAGTIFFWVMSGEQVGKWIASLSPSSRTCWPPPATGGWALLWNNQNTEQQSALLSRLLDHLLRFTLYNTRRWARRCVCNSSNKTSPQLQHFYCVSTNAVSQSVRPPRRHFRLLDICSAKQGISLSLDKRRKKKQLCAII